MPKQCVISLAMTDVEMCHIFRPWAFDGDSLAKFEYKWGLKYRTYNHDLSTNRVYLTRELRYLFESGFWAFLPLDLPLLKDFIKVSHHSSTKPFEAVCMGTETFKYRFVPLPGILRTPILRAESSTAIQSHAFPFTSLPVLELPIQPHFALMDLMHKYSKCNSLDINTSPEYQPYFKGFYQEHNHSFCLYRLWITSRVRLEFLRVPEGNDAGRGDGEDIQTFKRQDVFLAFDEDLASVRNDDRVGLRPLDSATNISDNGENENSDDEGEEDDEDEDEERRSLFDARLRRWIGGVGPSQPFEEPMEGAGCDHLGCD